VDFKKILLKTVSFKPENSDIMEAYGQSPWYPRNAHKGNIPYQNTNSPTGRTPAYRQAGIVLLVGIEIQSA